jgi:putative phage-type endonuclease
MSLAYNLEQGSQEWLKWRKIGSSDSPVIQGKSFYKKTPYMLWEERLGLRKPIKETFVMKKGKAIEEPVRKLFGGNVEPVCKESKEYPFMTASYDGMSFDDKIFCEIKLNGKDAHELAKKGTIREDHMIQMQHQWALAPKAEHAYYISYHEPRGEDPEVEIVEVKRNDFMIKSIVEKNEEFWEFLQKQIPPPLTDLDYVSYNKSNLLQMADDLREVRETIKRAKEEEERLETALRKETGDINSLIGDLKISKYFRAGSVQYDKIPELKGIDLNLFRKTASQCWRFTFAEKKFNLI